MVDFFSAINQMSGFLLSLTGLGLSAILLVVVGSIFLGAWLLAERVFLAFDRMRSFTYTFHFPVQRHRTQRSKNKLNKARV